MLKSIGAVIDIALIIAAVVLILVYMTMDEHLMQNNIDRFGRAFVVIVLTGVAVYLLKNIIK